MTRPGMTRDRWIALFLFGVLAFSPPVLLVFSAEVTVLGVPLLYLYIFIAWLALILTVAAIAESQAAREARERRAGRTAARKERRRAR